MVTICTYMYVGRSPEIEIAARVGISQEAYEKLRTLKKKRKESMTKIISDLIIKEYAEEM